MTDEDFYKILNSFSFTDKYWALCDKYPSSGELIYSYKGTKKDVLEALKEAGAEVKYHSVDRSYVIDPEIIGGYEWSGNFVKQRSGGLELMITGRNAEANYVGSNFAVLAYKAKQFEDPSFERGPFGGPPPYPRPDYNGDPSTLKMIAKDFVCLYREIKDNLRANLPS